MGCWRVYLSYPGGFIGFGPGTGERPARELSLAQLGRAIELLANGAEFSGLIISGSGDEDEGYFSLDRTGEGFTVDAMFSDEEARLRAAFTGVLDSLGKPPTESYESLGGHMLTYAVPSGVRELQELTHSLIVALWGEARTTVNVHAFDPKAMPAQWGISFRRDRDLLEGLV